MTTMNRATYLQGRSIKSQFFFNQGESVVSNRKSKAYISHIIFTKTWIYYGKYTLCFHNHYNGNAVRIRPTSKSLCGFGISLPELRTVVTPLLV